MRFFNLRESFNSRIDANFSAAIAFFSKDFLGRLVEETHQSARGCWLLKSPILSYSAVLVSDRCFVQPVPDILKIRF